MERVLVWKDWKEDVVVLERSGKFSRDQAEMSTDFGYDWPVGDDAPHHSTLPDGLSVLELEIKTDEEGEESDKIVSYSRRDLTSSEWNRIRNGQLLWNGE